MEKQSLTISNNVSELETVTAFVETLSEKWSVSQKVSFSLNLALEEVLTNIIFYGFNDDEKHEIDIECVLESNQLTVVISDEGKAFNPLEKDASEEIAKSLEERNIGGLGIHFVKTLMDSVAYQREGNINRLILIKTL